jgi:hypothetical protein
LTSILAADLVHEFLNMMVKLDVDSSRVTISQEEAVEPEETVARHGHDEF